MRVSSALILASALTIASPVFAQRPGARPDPTAVARAKLEALWHGDYVRVAEYTDPLELRRTWTAFEPLLAQDSADYLARRIFRLDSTAQVRRLSDAEFTARLMSFQFGQQATEFFSAVRGVEIVGELRQGRDTAHVVYRWRLPPDSLPLRSYDVETLVRCPAGWCAQMAGDYRGLIKVLREPMAPASGEPPPE